MDYKATFEEFKAAILFPNNLLNKDATMFSRSHFEKYRSCVAKNFDAFDDALDRRDFRMSRGLLEYIGRDLNVMRELCRNAYRELDFESYDYASEVVDYFTCKHVSRMNLFINKLFYETQKENKE